MTLLLSLFRGCSWPPPWKRLWLNGLVPHFSGKHPSEFFSHKTGARHRSRAAVHGLGCIGRGCRATQTLVELSSCLLLWASRCQPALHKLLPTSGRQSLMTPQLVPPWRAACLLPQEFLLSPRLCMPQGPAWHRHVGSSNASRGKSHTRRRKASGDELLPLLSSQIARPEV